jgi:L-ribulose-5-phosphate 3-epimerase
MQPARHRIGIIQGRLSPRPANRLQAFPFDSWEQEFWLARDLKLNGIEWIFEANRAAHNPLRSAQGRAQIRKVIEQSGVPVLSVCGDYFMVHRLSEPGELGIAASRTLSELIAQSSAIGARRILLPWLEEAALDTEEKRSIAISNLTRALPAATRHSVMLGLEMEISGQEYRALIEQIAHPLVKAYYDTGNSTAAGFDVAQDITELKAHLGALHIKDRKTGGGSQYLGQGDTNFRGLFEQLSVWDFRGDLVLQHYFENPANDARIALDHVRSFWPECAA